MSLHPVVPSCLDGPFEPLPVARQVRAANLKGIPGIIRAAGGEPLDVLRRHGIDPWQLQDPDSFLDGQSYVDTLEYCGTAFNQPLFGLLLADQQSPDVFGCVTALCRAAGRFGEAVGYMIDYIPVVHAPEGFMELLEGRETAELRWYPRTGEVANDQASYHGLMSVLKVLRMIGGPAFAPDCVTMTAAPGSKDVADVEDLLGAPVRTRARMNGIAFSRHFLDRPIASSNRLLVHLLGGYLERVKTASRKGVVERVEDYVRGALATRSCSIERCAEKLGTSPRSLQLRLAERNVTYTDIVERQRQAAASEYLRQTDLGFDEIARLVGYSEQASFNRAFKRWFDTTPRHYRAGAGAA